MSSLKNKIQQLSSDFFEEIVSIRHHLHRNPELSFEEYNTSAFISSRLKEYGISHKTGIVKTGIVGIIEGKNPSKKTIALRADMDALPIREQNKVPYTSANEGVMHACGHDVHTASLLGAARILQSLKNEFEGTVKLIFQPGEEKLPGGASQMIAAGVLENPAPSGIFGQHVFPSMETGKVGFRKGMYMASTDEIYISVKGKGGHAATVKPDTNPIYIASRVLDSLKKQFTDEGNEVPAGTPCVLAFGKFIADGATNVIPDEVKIEGTFRTMNEAWRKEAHVKMKATAEIVARDAGGSCELRVMDGYPFLANEEKLTGRAMEAAIEYLGKENVEELDIRMTGEDFAFYTQHLPACFYRLGTGNKSKGITSGVHTSTFDIDETALKTGMGLLAWLSVKELAH